MTVYIQTTNASGLNCTHRKVLLTAKDFPENLITFKQVVPLIVVLCIECKKYEVIEFK